MIRITPTTPQQIHMIPWVIAGTAVLILAITITIIRPIRAQARDVSHRRGELQQTIDQYDSQPGQASVELRLMQEHARYKHLAQEWERKKQMIQTFRDTAVLTDIFTSTIEGRIDYKIALFEARLRLNQKALQHAVSLPPDLGIPDTIGAEDDAETRLGQLAATVLLLEQCIAHGIPIIKKVQPMPPRIVPLYDDTYRSVTFYPIRLHMRSSYENLAKLMKTLTDEKSFFALRRFQVISMVPDYPDLVEVRAEWSAVVFTSQPMAAVRNTLELDESEHFY